MRYIRIAARRPSSEAGGGIHEALHRGRPHPPRPGSRTGGDQGGCLRTTQVITLPVNDRYGGHDRAWFLEGDFGRCHKNLPGHEIRNVNRNQAPEGLFPTGTSRDLRATGLHRQSRLGHSGSTVAVVLVLAILSITGGYYVGYGTGAIKSGLRPFRQVAREGLERAHLRVRSGRLRLRLRTTSFLHLPLGHRRRKSIRPILPRSQAKVLPPAFSLALPLDP